jgi:hypothetical protein
MAPGPLDLQPHDPGTGGHRGSDLTEPDPGGGQDPELERRCHGKPVGSCQGGPRVPGGAKRRRRQPAGPGNGVEDKKPGVAGLEGVRSV